MKKVLIILFFSIFIFSAPKREFRAAWFASVWNLDWPKTRGVSSQTTQKNELINMLDQLKAAGFNAVMLQIRPNCDALYNSAYEPWSYWLTGTEGTAPNPYWDPLQFAIEEAHKRGMELHAWINPYRVQTSTSTAVHANHPVNKYPSWVLTIGGSAKILNPGLMEVIDYIKSIVSDVITKYDVDGIVFDDYFYPYSPTITNEDQATFNAYPRGFSNIGDWRRNNVNMLIQAVYNEIKSTKQWVKFGISPFGIWKNGVPSGITGMDAYSTIYCDALAWLNGGYVDYLSPQLYWKIGGSQDYITLSNWWADQCYAKNRLFVPSKSLNVSYTTSELPIQILHDRSNSKISGTIFYRAGQMVNNDLNLKIQLTDTFYKDKALSFALSWLNNTQPNPPSGLTLTNFSNYKRISWNAATYFNQSNEPRFYVIYKSTSPNIDISNSANIAHIVYKDKLFYDDYNIQPGVTYYYCVTTISNYGVESNKSDIVPILSNFYTIFEKKSSNNTLPSWFGDQSTERGIAYTNNEILVVSRKDGLKVKRLKWDDLSEIGELNVTGISGGTYPLNDIETSWDGKILACNLTTSSNYNFKIYKWDNVSSAPTVYIDYANSENLRYGDNFTVIGNLNGNAAIYAAASNSNKVLKWTITNGNLNSTPTVITLSGVSSVGPSASVAPFGVGNEDFYVNGNSINPTLFGADGTNKGSISGAIIPTTSNAIKTFTVGAKRYLMTFLSNNTADDPNGQCMILVDVTNGLANVTVADIYGKTQRLGNVSNANSTGDVFYRESSGKYTVYVLATNNGIGAYDCMAAPLPVELVAGSFIGYSITDGIKLEWITKSEINNNRFEIERYDAGNWGKIAEVEGCGTSEIGNRYEYIDRETKRLRIVRYRLKQVDNDGKYEYVGDIEVKRKEETNYVLEQNYPNPFNPSTKIRYYLPEDGNIKLEIYNINGQLVNILYNGYKTKGEYITEFNAENLPAGIYLCRLVTLRITKIIKMIYLK
ncbi:MAG TPA: DUF4623 domain-containing protein [Ignavibacteriales bacterium]|nr:DUF4623 domain-containing protein [Ignavibacteriales bacterium]HPD66839.1 DUF4623 domain-containing protein [Ignavibacteriales bacterium]HRR18654.1 DUF4623 domain-containing protein [Ignavibacteriales bacterium]